MEPVQAIEKDEKPCLAPPLWFGRGPCQSLDEFHATLTQAGSRVDALEPAGDRKDFGFRTATVAVGDLVFNALAHSPVTIRCANGSGLTFIVPVIGQFEAVSQGIHLVGQQQQNAVLLSGSAYTLRSGALSSVMVELDRQRLDHTLARMSGVEPEESDFPDWQRNREIPLGCSIFRLGSVFEHVCALLRTVSPPQLELMGLDDLFYRSLALSLLPELTGADAAPLKQGGRRRVDRVCEYVMAHLSDSITLTELEAESGVSARSLQMAFQQRFNCTPMQWVRNARLHRARQELLAAKPGDTVTSVMLRAGLNMPNWFSTVYREQFGELPSETLRRAKSG